MVGLDNLSEGLEQRLHSLQRNFKFIRADVRDSEAVFKAAEGATHIIHLAESKIPRYGKTLEVLEVNVGGAENLLRAAVRERAHFIFGSTDEVYGKNDQIPLNEESALILGQPQVARWSFGASKMLGEHLCFSYRERHGLAATILRYFGVYGEQQPLDWRGGPQSVFVTSALRKEPMPVHGDGLQVRTFTYIDDAVRGTIMALESPHTEGEILNIASRDAISVINLAYLVRRLVGTDARAAIEFVPYSDFSRHYEDSRRRIADITKAFYLIGYEPEVNLADGFARTIEWQKRAVGDG